MKEDKITKKLDKIDAFLKKQNKIFQKREQDFDEINQVITKIDQKLNKIDKKYDKVDIQLDRIDSTLIKHTQKLLDHDEKLKILVTKDELGRFREEVLDGQDQMITILKRLDEKRIFTIARVKRTEEEIDQHKKKFRKYDDQLHKIKQKLKVA